VCSRAPCVDPTGSGVAESFHRRNQVGDAEHWLLGYFIHDVGSVSSVFR